MMVLEKPRGAASPRMGVAPNNAVPERQLNINYTSHRRLLASALARLAKSGYVVPPDEGLDLIHDFFVEAWDGLIRRFDADKASFETYMYGAFVRFARPRIVRLNRLRAGLSEPHALAALDLADSTFEERALNVDLLTVRRALARLPLAQRSLLATYVSDERPSERLLSQHLGISRYDLRLKLADALGSLAIEMGEFGGMDARGEAVAQALWRDNRTVKEAAGVLRLRASEVQAARLGLFKQLTQAVKGDIPMVQIDTQNHDQSAARTSSPTAQSLLAAALGSNASAADLAALRARAEEVWAFLEEPAADSLFSAEDLRPEQVAEIYAALAEDDVRISDDLNFRALVEASVSDEAAIGEAFAKVLMPNLKYDLTRFRDRVFLGAPRADPDYYQHLLKEPSVTTGGPHAKELAEFGMTPVMLIEGARAVSNKAMRFCRDEGITRYGDFIMDLAGRKEGYSLVKVLPRDAGLTEIVLATQLPSETASRLFDWLGRVAGYTPNLFDGFESSLWGDELHLKRTDVVEADLFQRWKPAPIVIAA